MKTMISNLIFVVLLSQPLSLFAESNIQFNENLETPLTVFQLYTKKGKPSAGYNAVINQIIHHFETSQTPIQVQFSEGLKYTVYAAHYGLQDVLLDTGDGWLLRVRQKRFSRFGFFRYYITLDMSHFVDSLGRYKRGYQILKENHIPVPDVQTVRGHDGEFLRIEKIDIDFFYSEFLDPKFLDSEYYLNLNLEEKQKIDSDFLDFVKKTALLQNIGDFKKNQLAYSNTKGWVLLDFTELTDDALRIEDPNVFQQHYIDDLINQELMGQTARMREFVAKPGLPLRLQKEALALINQARTRIFGISQISSYAKKRCLRFFEK